ncbi:unnamed protein product [Phytophthora fragariaefolia]|uniref:Unnamed protein product n=1 Tax=Phytophthora fragariaefolia TaxID=1490495 RepID=A0A9W6Y846_9STRA|nr:unnamed protein product [Phytophthora fragariaefolia]
MDTGFMGYIDFKVDTRPSSVIKSIGRTLEAFDDDNIIPAFGFGDSTTLAQRCFPFSKSRGCEGFDEVLKKYNEITPQLKLYGPTSFAPVIQEAIRAVKEDPGYHILVIIADGQVNEPTATRNAIVEASMYPICKTIPDNPEARSAKLLGEVISKSCSSSYLRASQLYDNLVKTDFIMIQQ